MPADCQVTRFRFSSLFMGRENSGRWPKSSGLCTDEGDPEEPPGSIAFDQLDSGYWIHLVSQPVDRRPLSPSLLLSLWHNRLSFPLQSLCCTRWHRFKAQLPYLQSHSLLHLEKQQKMVQAFRVLPPSWEATVMFLAPVTNVGVAAIREWECRCIISLSCVVPPFILSFAWRKHSSEWIEYLN